MNQTTEGSKGFAILVGGDTIPLEDGRVEIPPEQAKTTEKVLENIENGEYITITLSNCTAKDILSKEQINKLKANRESRKIAKTNSNDQR